MTTQEFNVPDVSCQHCVNAITNEVSGLPGVHTVQVDLGSKRVSVEADERTSTEAIMHAINKAGYDEVTLLNS